MQKRKPIRRLCERSRKIEKREYLRPGGVRGVELCSEVDRHSACDVGDRKCKSEYAHAEEVEDKHDEERPVFGARHVVRRDCRSTVEKRGRREQESRRCFMLELEAQTLTRGESPTLHTRCVRLTREVHVGHSLTSESNFLTSSFGSRTTNSPPISSQLSR